MTTRTKATIAAILIILLCQLLYWWNNRDIPYERPPGLTTEEAMLVAANKPGREWTLKIETARACWQTGSSRIEICVRRS